MSWFWPRGASGSQRDGVVQLVCSSVVRRTRGQPTGGAGIACERCADLQEQAPDPLLPWYNVPYRYLTRQPVFKATSLLAFEGL